MAGRSWYGPGRCRQPHQSALRSEPGGRTGAVQPDQRQQTGHLGLSRHQTVQESGQPLGVAGEGVRLRLPGGGEVTLVEQQVDHREDLRETVAQLLLAGDAVRDARLGDLLLGAVMLPQRGHPQATVHSRTRNARAICALVSPHTSAAT